MHRGGWPDPIRPVAVAPSRALTGREGSERSGPGPVLTGRWGRVPVPRPGPAPPAEVDDYRPWYRRPGPVAFAPPPPPPPAPSRRPRLELVRLRAAAALRRITRSRRWRIALVEIAVAAAIIGTVAAVTTRPARSPEQLQASWGRQAMPTITALIEDLTPVQPRGNGHGNDPAQRLGRRPGLPPQRSGPGPEAATSANAGDRGSLAGRPVRDHGRLAPFGTGGAVPTGVHRSCGCFGARRSRSASTGSGTDDPGQLGLASHRFASHRSPATPASHTRQPPLASQGSARAAPQRHERFSRTR